MHRICRKRKRRSRSRKIRTLIQTSPRGLHPPSSYSDNFLDLNHDSLLTDQEKRVWNDKAAEAMDGYKKELEEYNKSAAASLD
ncbi:hypothetical protein L6164_019370 [Bauhinia variegata]|uniref:Uncharacterized protein n=1 Tax=Bauhinia variegata TaxID=167791 RepID=A0ACB9MWC3_BAUVA|nr:hypothetical protein L6164_019370 [Bauhinia variegata]